MIMFENALISLQMIYNIFEGFRMFENVQFDQIKGAWVPGDKSVFLPLEIAMC